MGNYNMALIWQSHEAKLIRKANEKFIRTGKLDPEIINKIELCREAFKRTATAGR